MDPMDFEIAIEKLDCTADVWRRLVDFAVAAAGSGAFAYHHLPPAGAPDAHLLRHRECRIRRGMCWHSTCAPVSQGYAVLAAVAQRSLVPGLP